MTGVQGDRNQLVRQRGGSDQQIEVSSRFATNVHRGFGLPVNVGDRFIDRQEDQPVFKEIAILAL
jgi:hypothetical protein